jgi:hypothetical protein
VSEPGTSEPATSGAEPTSTPPAPEAPPAGPSPGEQEASSASEAGSPSTQSTPQPGSAIPAEEAPYPGAAPGSAAPTTPPAASASTARRPGAGDAAARPSSPIPAGPDTVERFGHPMRHFPVAISSEAMALAWANQENAPQGAIVLVDHEINPRGFHGRLWDTPQPDTLACSIVLRPPVSVEEGDVSWLVVGLAGAEAVEQVTGRKFATWWPDEIVEAESKDPVAATRAEVQLGPGQVKAAVITICWASYGVRGFGVSR